MFRDQKGCVLIGFWEQVINSKIILKCNWVPTEVL